jgi:hypothetical protein
MGAISRCNWAEKGDKFDVFTLIIWSNYLARVLSQVLRLINPLKDNNIHYSVYKKSSL